MTSQLRYPYVVSCKYLWDILQFSVTWIVRMIRAKNCEQLCKFIELMAKLLFVPFSGHGVLLCVGIVKVCFL